MSTGSSEENMPDNDQENGPGNEPDMPLEDVVAALLKGDPEGITGQRSAKAKRDDDEPSGTA